MNGPREPGREPLCDQEAIFELADGTLGAEQEREVRAHLRSCPACRDLYEKELKLNAFLDTLKFAEPPSQSVCRGVAMALPTRHLKARFLWAVLAMALLLVASLALSLDGTNPAAFAVSALDVFWGLVSGFVDVVSAVFVATGTVILGALAVGALLDLLIAATVLLLTRRRTRMV
jgi:predicted anti-sigma-YlaC factor YlaD